MLKGWSWPLLSLAVALTPQHASALQPSRLQGRQAHRYQDLHKQHHDVKFLRRNAPASNVTVDFEVAAPVAASDENICATQALMNHTFGQSYGQPFTAMYKPPSKATCGFNRVVINFTVTSRGRQFDRLATMWLTDLEVFRTSTAEPTEAGITWTYIKDMSAYMALWTQPQTIIFELDNNVDSTYTGLYDTTLTATFYKDANPPVVADAILPISTRQGSNGMQSIFSVPGLTAPVQHIIPPNLSRAAVSIAATGQIDEEFWYTNVFSSQTLTFNSTAGAFLPGGPFREVQLLIDGKLAGVVWPFPVIFTGGIIPYLWRPIVGIQAFDLAETEIDITPFLPYLMDGRAHSFTIGVFQLADNAGNGTATLTLVEEFWLVSGKIFLFYKKGTPSFGAGASSLPTITGGDTPGLNISSKITTYENGTNATLTYHTEAWRAFRVSSLAGTWEQKLKYTNQGFISAGGFSQSNTQLTRGTHKSANALDRRFNQHLDYRYPITVTTNVVAVEEGLNLDAAVTHGLWFKDSGRSDLSLFSLNAGPASEATNQSGTGHYSSVPNSTANYGTTYQTFTKKTAAGTYSRSVSASNGTLLD